MPSPSDVSIGYNDNFVDSSLAVGQSEAAAGAPVAIVVVAHSCPVVSIGIASTLRRVPGYHVRVVEPHEGQFPLGSFPQGSVIFVGDLASVHRFSRSPLLAEAAKTSRVAKLVIHTTAADRAALSDVRRQSIHACLPIDCREEELLDAVNRLAAARPSHGAGFRRTVGGLPPAVKRRVREFIEANIGRRIDIDALASIAGLSKTHFSRMFRQTFGSTPYQYVLDLRVSLAANLLRTTDRPLVDVSLEAGFVDQSHLTRLFTKFMGDTPANFRRRYR